MANPFITSQDLTDYLGITVTSDPGATIALDAACDTVRTVACQTFNRGTSTLALDGTGTDYLNLPELPVNSAGTVTVNGGTVTDYVLDKDRGALIRKTTSGVTDWWSGTEPMPTVRWPTGRQNIVVTYDHGYSDADLPRDVRMVALSVASRLIVQGVAAYETQGDVSIRYAVNATDLTDGEKRILRKYKDGRRPD